MWILQWNFNDFKKFPIYTKKLKIFIDLTLHRSISKQNWWCSKHLQSNRIKFIVIPIDNYFPVLKIFTFHFFAIKIIFHHQIWWWTILWFCVSAGAMCVSTIKRFPYYLFGWSLWMKLTKEFQSCIFSRNSFSYSLVRRLWKFIV